MLKYLCALGLYWQLLLSLDFTDADIGVRAPIGGTFRLHMFPQPLDNPISCTLTNPQNVATPIPLDYQIGDQINITKIEPLGNGQCGARIHNTISRGDAGRWILSISDGTKTVNETYRITAIAWENPTNRTTSALIGTSGMVILCGPSSNMLYCEMRDPLGNLAWLSHTTRCQTTVQRLTADHFGVWTCTVALIGGSSEIQATHTLKLQETANEITIAANDTSLGKMITWQVDGLWGASLWCRAFLPNGKTIMVSKTNGVLPGMDNGEYISVSTNLADHKCGVLIAGNFTDEYYGLWRLEIGVNNRRAMGGFVRMPEGKIPGLEDHRNTVRNESISHEIAETNVVAGNSFRINCEVPYPASYCWIGGPFSQEYTQSENLTVGRCSQVINSSTISDHNGIWTCNIAHMYGGPEEQFLTKVNIIENSFESMYPETTVNLGDKALIACRSVLGYALEYCRFIRPDGKGFGLVPGANLSDQYSYEGPGLIYGYCGLAISSVKAVDIGEWRCASRSLGRIWEAESWGKSILEMKKPGIETSSSGFSYYMIIGLILGAFLMLLFVVAVIAVWQNRKPTRRNSQDSQATVIVKSNS